MPGARSIGLPNEDKIRAAMQAANPESVRVVLGDDETVKTLAVSKTRRRWSTFLETLAKLGAWTKLELLNKKGEILSTVENDGDAGELEDLGGKVSALGRDERVMKLVIDGTLRAQREVLAMRDRDVATVMQAVGQVVKELTGAIHVLQRVHGEQMQSALEAAEHNASMQNKDWVSQATELAEAAPHLAPVVGQLVAMVKSTLASGKPPNGANGAGAAPKS